MKRANYLSTGKKISHPQPARRRRRRRAELKKQVGGGDVDKMAATWRDRRRALAATSVLVIGLNAKFNFRALRAVDIRCFKAATFYNKEKLIAGLFTQILQFNK